MWNTAFATASELPCQTPPTSVFACGMLKASRLHLKLILKNIANCELCVLTVSDFGGCVFRVVIKTAVVQIPLRFVLCCPATSLDFPCFMTMVLKEHSESIVCLVQIQQGRNIQTSNTSCANQQKLLG